MLPPSASPPANLGLYWTDEQVIMSLDKLVKGSPLPDDVMADINPYQYKPSNLPDGIWYFVHSTETKETEHGFWKARGEACEIYKDSAISGWRTTLEFFEGAAPLGQRTDWLMQEYKITQKRQSDKNDLKGCRTLCRIFLCGGEGPSSKTHTNNRDVDTVGGNVSRPQSTVPSTESTSRRDYPGDTMEKNMDPATERVPDPVSEAILELDHILSGDYLELADLVGEESRPSSSDNSSCKSSISDEFFDSLLREIEDDKKGSSSKFSVAALARPNEVVMQPAAVGSLGTAIGIKLPAQTTGPGSAMKANDGKQKADHRNEGASSTRHEASSSNSHKAILNGEKVSASKKKLKNKYLCFMPF